eukprot:Clim_evm24s25 gene=Clim_evmTU24s25
MPETKYVPRAKAKARAKANGPSIVKKSAALKTPTKRSSAAAKTKGPVSNSPASVLAKVRQLKKEHHEEAEQKADVVLEDLNLENVAKEVVEMEDDNVKGVIEAIVLATARNILAELGFEYIIPSRAASNQLYVPELDRIVLKDGMNNRPFANVSSVRKATITTRVLELIHEVVSKGIHITKRDLFYTDVNLFSKQSESDAVLDDIACMVGCTRNSLNVVASEKGVVVGRLKFRDMGDLVDCTKQGSGGKAIPALISRVTDIETDADFVLLVEKDAAFMRLAEDRFYNQYPCIIMTAKGQPDIATRLFLQMIKKAANIPILGLVDSDPYGLKILSVYMSGSKNMSYDSASLATADIKWLGVRPSDLNRYNIPAACRLPMTEHDRKTGYELLEEDFVKKNPEWVKELKIMLDTGEKAEIQALSNFGFQYLTQEFLPRKIREGDWI